jgi:heme exporter protein A
MEAAVFGVEETEIAAALEELGLAAQQDLPCLSLSAGQRQRVALARLLMRKAPLWILDEPCASLDYQAQQQVQAILSAHAQSGGSVLFTTHQALPFEGVDVQELILGGVA